MLVPQLVRTDQAVRAKSIYLGGQDVTFKRTGSGNGYGAPIESVIVTEQGPGGVSSMTFTTDDPALELGVAEGMEVRFVDNALDYPIFYGWIQAFSVAPAFGDQGRQITITAVGVEVVLDWAVTNIDLTFPAGSVTTAAAAIQSIVANSTGLGPIRAFADPLTIEGTQASPIFAGPVNPNARSFSIPTGTTVREAIRQVYTAWSDVINALAVPLMVTVDFSYGLRAWQEGLTVALRPDDYVDEAIAGAPAGPFSEGLSYNIDAQAVVRAVVVRGASLSVSVTAGVGLMGQVAVINDSTITTAADAMAVGQAYLTAFRSGVRGGYRQTDRAPVLGVHAGSLVSITNAQVGLAVTPFRIMEIQKAFNPSGREDWSISFGGLRPSAASLLRRLTRSTLS